MKRKFWSKLLYKEIKQTILCPECGEYTSYCNHFVPRFFGNGDVYTNPTPKWSINCKHCHKDIWFSISVHKTYKSGGKL